MIDDFIRNFYVKMGLTRTAEVFESEWYELKATGRLEGANTAVPDVYLHNNVSWMASTIILPAIATTWCLAGFTQAISLPGSRTLEATEAAHSSPGPTGRLQTSHRQQ